MIHGLEIIEKTEITTISDLTVALLITCTVSAIISLILIFITTYFKSKKQYKSCKTFVVISLSLVIFSTIIAILALLSSSLTEQSTGQYYYEVLAKGTVNLDDIYEDYDIISVQDNVWTLKDKEQ